MSAPLYALRHGRMAGAYYEAAEPSRYHKTRNDKRSGNAQVARAAVPILRQARHLDENFDIASGILDVLVARIVGRGVQPEPQVMLTDGNLAVDLNTQLLRLWDQWIFACEVTGQHHYYPFQRLLARSWLRDGEVFGQRIIGEVPGLKHGTALPYSLEGLECDYIPNDYNDPQQGIIQGIQVNAWGKPIFFHVWKTHPGDNNTIALERKRVPAPSMLHIRMAKRLHQLRGVSIFSTVVNRLDDIKEVDENERIAARVAAAMAAVINKGTPDSYEAPSDDLDAEGNPKRREMFFEPGIIFDDLMQGESVQTIDTKRPNNALIAFRDAQVRAAASGTMAAFSSVSKNYNGTYSAQRQELVEQWDIYQMLASEFTYKICQPVWDGFIDACMASAAITVPRDVDKLTLYDCAHTGPSMTWIDPEKEVNAHALQMQWLFKSRTRIIRERGDNPDQVNREIVRDQEERARLGLEMTAKGAESAQEQTQDDDERAPATAPPENHAERVNARQRPNGHA